MEKREGASDDAFDPVSAVVAAGVEPADWLDCVERSELMVLMELRGNRRAAVGRKRSINEVNVEGDQVMLTAVPLEADLSG
jgi:hypothetical protein